MCLALLLTCAGGSVGPWKISEQEKWHDWVGRLGNSGCVSGVCWKGGDLRQGKAVLT